MLNQTKLFIEENIDLLEMGMFDLFFKRAYDDDLTTAEMRELHEVLLNSLGFDSTQLRNDLLYEYIKSNLDDIRIKTRGLDIEDMRVVDTYAVQFLRNYLNNTFGFLEHEAIEFMVSNQNQLGVKLTPVHNVTGNYYMGLEY